MTLPTIILAILLALGCLMLPRRYLALPFIIAACMIPMNQRMFIGSLDFPVLRILVAFSVLRILFRGESETIHWSSFDKLVLAWNVSTTIIYTIQWGTLNAFLFQCGVMYDSLGTYWIFRNVFRSFTDITTAIRLFAICAIIFTPLILVEKITHISPFSYFGPTGAKFHRGRFRCAGPFPHYIMMGCFWCSIIPLFYGSVKEKINCTTAKIGIILALMFVLFSASSTPLLTLVAIIAFWLCHSYRQHGSKILLAICGILFILHFIREKPVWHLISRLNIFGGSTGWHRYYLFDEFINHTSEWFFLGTKSTGHWGSHLVDVTNQFVLEAVLGGFITLLIFIIMLYKAIKISGRCSLLLANRKNHWIAWGICISLLSHIVTFWGVSYFGQILLLLYMTLAMVGFLSEQTENQDQKSL